MIAGALAATPQVLDLDGDTSMELVADRLGLPESPAALSLQSVAQRSARLEGGGALSWCGSSPVAADAVRARLAQAETSIAYMEFQAAATTLDAAIADLVCLVEPLDGALAARLHFLDGLVAHRTGALDEATAAFLRAFDFQPDLPWDETFPPKALSLFEQTRARWQALPRVDLALVPDGEVRIDGRPTRAPALTPGPHLVRLGQALAVLEVVPETSPELVIPALLVADTAPTGEALLSALSRVFGEHSMPVVLEGRVWTHESGSWQDQALTPPAAPVAEPVSVAGADPPAATGPHPGRTRGGGGRGAIGAAAGTVSLIAARESYRSAQGQNTGEGYATEVDKLVFRSRFATVSYGVAALGSVFCAVGILVGDDTRIVLRPFAAGLQVQVIR